MFCAKCGKQIDDDSKFCPFCGNTIEKNREQIPRGSAPDMRGSGQQKQSFPVKYAACGAAVIAVLVVACVFLFRSLGNRAIEKSFLGEMFSLSWQEIFTMSEEDFKNILDKEDLSYICEEDSSSWGFGLEETSSFMGGDSSYVVAYLEGVMIQHYEVVHETRENCRDSYESIREYLDRNIVKGAVAIDLMSDAAGAFDMLDEYDFQYDVVGEEKEYYMYLMEEGTEEKDLDKYLDMVIQNLERMGEDVPDSESIEEYREELEGYEICKIVLLDYIVVDDEVIKAVYEDKSYSNNVCAVTILYLPVKRGELISSYAMAGWDILSGKQIDTETIKSSVDTGFQASFRYLPYGALKTGNAVYSALYMMDKYNYDIFEGRYIDKKDVNFWYITNFQYDMDEKKIVSLDDYKYLPTVYCAAEYNFNVDEFAYFESDYDRALYLVEHGYNPETGRGFDNNDEKRLWFMKNYGYDIVAEKEVDKEIGEALEAYQKKYESEQAESNNVDGMCLIYLNDDNIPECLIGYALDFGCGGFSIFSYAEGNIFEHGLGFGSYAERKNIFIISSYIRDYGYAYSILSIDDTQHNFIEYDVAHSWDIYEQDAEFLEPLYGPYDFGEYGYLYEIEGREASKEEISAYIDSFKAGKYPGELCDSAIEAYDAARTSVYTVNMPEIGEFELVDGVLKVSTNDGSRYDWKASTPFSISYPVADDCVWEYGWYNADFVKDKDISYEELKETITVEFEWYESIYQKDGKEWFVDYGIESPLTITITVQDGVVINVRVTSP